MARAARTLRVLVVEPDTVVREVTRAILHTSGYEVVTADSAKQGLEAYRRAGGDVDAVVVDLAVNDLSFDTFLEEARDLKLGARFLVTSATYREEDVRQVLERHAAPYLQKPFHLQRLDGVIRSLVESAQDPPDPGFPS